MSNKSLSDAPTTVAIGNLGRGSIHDVVSSPDEVVAQARERPLSY